MKTNLHQMEFSDFFKKAHLHEIYFKKLHFRNNKGIDKKSPKDFRNFLDEEIDLIRQNALSGKYKFSPYLELLKIKNRDKKPRLISIPTVRDRLTLLATKEFLHSTFSNESQFKIPNIYISNIKKDLYGLGRFNKYFKSDIENFYDSINQEQLLELLESKIKEPIAIDLILKAIKNPTVPKSYKKKELQNFIPSKGVPQGLSISNILAQIYATQIDLYFSTVSSFSYYRYVDDILLLHDKDGKEVEDEFKESIKPFDLSINTDKTESKPISDSFTFLGYKIKPNRVSISSPSVTRFLDKIASKVSWYKKVSRDKTNLPEWLKEQDKLELTFIEEINEKITGAKADGRRYGWLLYFSEMDDLPLLYQIDFKIAQIIDTNLKGISLDKGKVKNFVRSYYEINYNFKKSNYILDYDKIDDVLKRRHYLNKRGKLNPEINYTDTQINSIFEKNKAKYLSSLEQDVSKYFSH